MTRIKCKGSFEFKANGNVNFEYGCQVYNEKQTVNNVEFCLVKDNKDGTFTEASGSRYATTIEANRMKVPKKVLANSFTFEAKENEVYRMFMKSNVDDGFFLQCDTNGQPLYYASIVFNEMKPIDKRIVDMIEKATGKSTK